MKMNRRTMLTLAGVAGLMPWLKLSATEAEAAQAIKKIVGSSKIRSGRVTLEIPPLVENGNLVEMKVAVASPMTQADHVRAIHIIAEGNPLPNIVSF